MLGIEVRDFVRFFGVIAGLAIVHATMFSVDDFDVTQFVVMAACYVVLRAIREPRP